MNMKILKVKSLFIFYMAGIFKMAARVGGDSVLLPFFVKKKHFCIFTHNITGAKSVKWSFTCQKCDVKSGAVNTHG